MESGQHTIPLRKGRRHGGLVLVHPPLPDFSASVSQEMMRTVSRINSFCQNDCRILAITGWGAPGSAAELSLEMARGLASLSRQSVLLVDADFANPRLHKKLGTPAIPGLTELLMGEKTLQEVVRPTCEETFFFLPAGAANRLIPSGRSTPVCVDEISAVPFFEKVVIHTGPFFDTSSPMLPIAESDDVVVFAVASDASLRSGADALRRQNATRRGFRNWFQRLSDPKAGIASFRQRVEERSMNTMEPQHAITSWKGRRSTGLELVHSPLPEFSVSVSKEMMKTVARMNGLFQSDCRVLAVTGWDDSDQAAELSFQLARGLASLSQQSVILVDADFVTPGLHQKLQTPAAPGLAELIAGEKSLGDVVRPTLEETFFFLPSGAADKLGPRELSAPACADVISVLRFFWKVVIHTGPLMERSSAMVITPESDGVVVALAAGVRRREEVDKLQHQIATLNGKLLGAVLTEGAGGKPRRFHRWLR
jgi:Mrp family chromosome partitioning ATPase